jgi:hypothetical protein
MLDLLDVISVCLKSSAITKAGSVDDRKFCVTNSDFIPCRVACFGSHRSTIQVFQFNLVVIFAALDTVYARRGGLNVR